ncbi:MAG: hypothetical protein FD135_4677 [Comamonadaceae bacterium]|nr:MAG: hypothetical protein FD135_4677 [Comamonadaceae bacterium]
MADTPKVQSLDDVLRWLDRLENATQVHSLNAWAISATLAHMAQSVDMSMDGFPQPKSVLFQSTLGSAAFAVFRLRGRMSHGLTEPIPGAPALPQTTNWKPGVAQLRTAVQRFQRHTGTLQPHFAYGALSHADYALAHTLHIANHQDDITVA